MKNRTKGLIGETAVTLELLKLGYDVFNLNGIYHNYKNADLECINPENMKTTMIQVKTGTTHNIMTGFISELDGTIPDLEKKVIGPWVFVLMDKKFNTEFYVLTKDETIELLKTSSDWYANSWNRKLNKKPVVCVELSWLQGGVSKASKPLAKKQHPEYQSSLKVSSQNRWDKIKDLLSLYS